MTRSGFSQTGAGTLPAAMVQPVEAARADAGPWAAVLAGGIGSRFWPLSSPERPKQLLALVGDRPLIAETVARLQPLVPPERVLILTSRDIAPAIQAAIPEVPAENMLIEPRPAGTASAVALAARELQRRAGPETLCCTLPADIAVAFPEIFRHVVREASRIAANDDVLVAVGVPASRPETAFGYIAPGPALSVDAPLERGGVCQVQAFVEKPPRALAEELVRRGALWNSGVLVWRVRALREELRRHVRELIDADDDVASSARYAEPLRTVSIERGLLERSDRLVVIRGEFGWDDVGTWASLRRARELDDSGNGGFGPVHFVDASGNVVHSEGSTVVMYGVTGLLVVSLDGLTFVTTLERAAELRPLLDALPPGMRTGGAPPKAP